MPDIFSREHSALKLRSLGRGLGNVEVSSFCRRVRHSQRAKEEHGLLPHEDAGVAWVIEERAERWRSKDEGAGNDLVSHGDCERTGVVV